MRNVVIARAVAEARRAELMSEAEARRLRPRARREPSARSPMGDLVRGLWRRIRLARGAGADVGASIP
jgi:hypothetical protein